jgi:S-adenosylmethionine:tRNA ribosyltransferase-isomerase
VVRALETAYERAGRVEPYEGFTSLVIEGTDSVSTIDGILTGWHEPKASHLSMLEAIAGSRRLASSYARALELGYLWHEFGDVQLLFQGERRK